MRCRIIVVLLYSVLFSTLLFSSFAAHRRRRHRSRHSRKSCNLLQEALRKAYYAQVDLIRRGIPTRVVQSEFTWAINYFLKMYPSFNYRPLAHTCLHTRAWYRVFDRAHRARFAIKYLQNIRRLVRNITFLSFESYPTLPSLTHRETKLVETMWSTCLVRLQKRPRAKYKVSDFPFPKNVDVLYDPAQERACNQYNKFTIDSNNNYDVDAKSVLTALTVISVNLYHNRGNPKSIRQMLTHFVGFVFNGVRCLRLEGADIKVPAILVSAYARNIAMIQSTITKNIDHAVNMKAVELVFRAEIESLLSYNSWGHLSYAVLSPESSIPIVVNVMTKIFGSTQYKLLLLYTKNPLLTTPEKSISNRWEVVSGTRQVTCGKGYVLMPRKEVQDPLERCCNDICYRWSLLMASHVSYSAESCCKRCNKFNRCEPEITKQDMSDNNDYSFYVPEYGEQDKIDMFLVAI